MWTIANTLLNPHNSAHSQRFIKELAKYIKKNFKFFPPTLIPKFKNIDSSGQICKKRHLAGTEILNKAST